MGSGLSKVRNRVSLISRKQYNKFIKNHPKSGITYSQFITVLNESNAAIKEFILNNELGFKLPNNLGYIAVDKFKPNKTFTAIDWPNTLKLGKIIPLTNFHTFGYTFKIKLYKNQRMKPLEAYVMTPHRLLNRELAKRIKSGKQNYISLDKSYFSKRFTIENYLKESSNGLDNG